MAGSALPFTEEIVENRAAREKAILDKLLNATRQRPGERTVTADAKDFTEKRAALQARTKTAAGATGGLIGGLMKAISMKNLGGAAGLAGAGILAAPTLDAFGEKVKDTLVPDNQRDTMMDEGSTAFAKAVGGELGQSTIGLFGDLLSKSLSGLQSIPRNMARKNMFEQLQQDDDVLAQADPSTLQDAYHTMVRFAPTLATDKNAVRSFLRESVLYGTGPNVITIKQLADAERATTGER